MAPHSLHPRPSPLPHRGRLTYCVNIRDDPSLSSSSSSDKVGRKVQVRVPLKVHHVARLPELDLNGMVGVVRQHVGVWKGKRITPNFLFKVEFLLLVEGQAKPSSFSLISEKLCTLLLVINGNFAAENLFMSYNNICISITFKCVVADGSLPVCYYWQRTSKSGPGHIITFVSLLCFSISNPHSVSRTRVVLVFFLVFESSQEKVGYHFEEESKGDGHCSSQNEEEATRELASLKEEIQKLWNDLKKSQASVLVSSS